MEFLDAHDLDEALTMLHERGPEVNVLAGGTDVVIQQLRGQIAPATLLHIRAVPGLRGVSAANRATLMGALTTHSDLQADPLVRERHAALAEAAATVGGRQTQNVGTIAGNVVNASPAADLIPALLVGDAAVIVRSAARGERTLPLEEFVLGRRQTALEPDELVTSISLASPEGRSGQAYVKLGRRGAMEVAIVGVAARVDLAVDGSVAAARVAVCSVAPKAIRVPATEAALAGSRLEEDALAEACNALEAASSPIDDVRSSAAYRRRVLAPLLRRAVAAAAERANGGG